MSRIENLVRNCNPDTEVNLPKRTEHFLQYGAPEGQRHQEYLAAACQLRDSGMLMSEAERLILDRAQQDGLETREALTIVRDVFAAPTRQPIRERGRPMTHKFGSAPVRKPKPLPPPSPVPSAIPDGARLLMNAMFREGEWVRVVPGASDEERKGKPASKGYVLKRELWLNKLSGVDGDPNRIVRPEGGVGVYMGINPLRDQENVTDSGVEAYRHVLLEWDGLVSMDQQWAVIQAMHLPALAVINSGGKSLHVILRVDAETKADYDDVVRRLYAYAEQWHVDPANTNPSRLTRLPGCQRGSKRQELIFLNPEARNVRDYLEEYDDGLPPITPAKVLLDDVTLVEPPILIEHILHKGCKMVLGSASKAHKSWQMLDMAVSLTSGVPYLGHKTTKCRVILINFEILPAFLKSRLDAVWRAKCSPDISNLEVWNLRGHGANFSYNLNALIRRLQRGNYDVVIIDPIYKALAGKDENSAGDVGSICADLERIACDCNASVIFTAHYSKGNQSEKEAMDRISGSGVFARDPDVIMTLTANEASEKHWTCDLVLRNLPEHPAFVVHWEFPLMRVENSPSIKPENLKKKRGRPALWDLQDVIRCMEPGISYVRNDLAATVVSCSGMSNSHALSLIRRCEQEGKVASEGRGGNVHLIV